MCGDNMCDIFISAVTHNLPGGAAGPKTHISQSGHGHHHHHCLGSKKMEDAVRLKVRMSRFASVPFCLNLKSGVRI